MNHKKYLSYGAGVHSTAQYMVYKKMVQEKREGGRGRRMNLRC